MSATSSLRTSESVRGQTLKTRRTLQITLMLAL
jgi:hypothetical protein